MSTQSHQRFGFFGTGTFATIVLDTLEESGLAPELIITAPDRPAGRGMQLTPSPVKIWAGERHIETLTPETLDAAFAQELAERTLPVCAVVDYGKLIPKAVLDAPTHGMLNVHPSLLPHHRGPAPIEAQVLADDPDDVGVSIMLLDETLDHGPLLGQTQVRPDPWPIPARELEEALAYEGGALLSYLLPAWVAGTVKPEPQDHHAATYTKLIRKEDAQLDLAHGRARKNYLKVCAYDRNPRAYFFTNGGKRVIVTDARWEDETLRIMTVLPEGKREMSYDTFLKSR